MLDSPKPHTIGDKQMARPSNAARIRDLQQRIEDLERRHRDANIPCPSAMDSDNWKAETGLRADDDRRVLFTRGSLQISIDAARAELAGLVGPAVNEPAEVIELQAPSGSGWHNEVARFMVARLQRALHGHGQDQRAVAAELQLSRQELTALLNKYRR